MSLIASVRAPSLVVPSCAILAICLLAGCVQAPSDAAAPSEQPLSVGILMFGDSGYHLMYPDQDDFEDRYSEEQYLESEWQDWLEDKRPEDEYEARPFAISPVTGGVVPATGMDAISQAMQDYCASLATCDFGLMLGDNIYPSGATLGADGKSDTDRFHDMLGKPYGNLVADDPGFVTYVTLGNHDWETSREAGFLQIDYLEQSDSFYIDGTFYRVKPPSGGGDVELFVIDTSMMLAATTVYEDYLDENGAEVVTDVLEDPDYFVEPMTQAELDMAAWLEQALAGSTAKWKLVVAHHPIWSSSGSKFEQGRALRDLILPAMCRYADAFLVGHDHTLEIHTDDCSAVMDEPPAQPLVQVVSGAASKQRPVNTNFIRQQALKYPQHETILARGLLWGFAHMQIEGDTAVVQLLSVPDDGSAEISVDFEYTFQRRTAP